MYTIVFSKQAEKDKKLLKQAGLDKKTRTLLDLMLKNPFQSPPSYEKLKGQLNQYYSRRINAQHRLVYQVDVPAKTVKIVSMWSHYE